MKKNILLVEDQKEYQELISKFLARKNYNVFVCGTGDKTRTFLKNNKPDFIILDYKLPDTTGIELLKYIKQLYDDIPVIFLSGEGTIPVVTEAVKAGAIDFLEKKVFFTESLELSIDKAENLSRIINENIKLKNRLSDIYNSYSNKFSIDSLLGKSLNIHKIKDQIKKIVNNDVTVLITGPTGTGKELIARIIHYNSLRKTENFIAVNCGAIPVNLIESELFGYKKGAFTGAMSDCAGKFEAADSGTIFLDEIGELSLEGQVKLLRMIQEKVIYRLGSAKPVSLDVRVIAATNKDLNKEVENGNFREDLFYRLNIVPIHILPLSERKEDIQPIAEYYLKNISERYGKPNLKFSGKIIESFKKHQWKGNVRELKNIIEFAVINTDTETVDNKLVESRLNIYSGDEKLIDFNKLSGLSLTEYLKKLKFRIIEKTLHANNGNLSKTAEELKVPVSTLHRWNKDISE